ncbi:MAG: diguanylate cyclase [Clostridium sp.]
MKYIPGGIYTSLTDEQITLVSISENFLMLLGYSDVEIREIFHNHLMEIIYPDDRMKVADAIKQQYSNGDIIEIEYRVQTKDGTLLWILNRGKIIVDNETSICYCAVLDITKEKDEREQLRLALECHKIIMNQATDIIFEWDIKADTLVCSSNWYKKFGYAPISEHISKNMLHSQNIYSEDMKFFKEIMEETAAGTPYSETEFRIKNAKGENIFCRIRATTQYDSSGVPIKAVGVIIDISKEKYQWKILMDQTQRDSLTGLFHKNAAKQAVNLYLKQTDSPKSIMLLIDLDDFKQVNDKYGHLCGDALLTNMAKVLHEVFRSGDIISRVGGDEFVVFLPEITKKRVDERIEDLRAALSEVSVSGKKGVVSCSIGVSLCPDHGVDFNSLYKCADVALYYVKSNKKGEMAVYSYEMEEIGSARQMEIRGSNTAIDSDVLSLSESWGQRTFKKLYETKDILTAVQQMLEMIGRAYRVSRISIFEDSDDGLSNRNTIEWCNEGIESRRNDSRTCLDKKEFRDYYNHFDENGVFYCHDIYGLEPGLYQRMSEQGVFSFLQCSVQDKGKNRGYIEFCDCYENRIWTREEIESFIAVSKVIGVFLLKQRLEEREKSRI